MFDFFCGCNISEPFCNSVLLQRKCTGSTFSCVRAYIIADIHVTLMQVWLVLKGLKFTVSSLLLLFVFLLWKWRKWAPCQVLQMTHFVSWLSSNDTDHLPEVEHCIDWYKHIFLDTTVAKTKEMVTEPLFYGHNVQTVLQISWDRHRW